MLMTRLLAASTVAWLAWIASASAATVEYRILLDGQDLMMATPADFADIGNITLSLQARVTENNWTVGGVSQPFGLGAGGVHITEANGIPGNVQFDPDLPFNPGSWLSQATFPPMSLAQGALDAFGDDVRSAGASFAPNQWGANFNAVGVGGFTTIVQGQFSWDGSATGLQLGGPLSLSSVLGLTGPGGSIRSRTPDSVIFDSVVLKPVPEPASIALAGMAVIGLGFYVRRSRRTA